MVQNNTYTHESGTGNRHRCVATPQKFGPSVSSVKIVAEGRTPRLRTLNGVQYPVFVEASKTNCCINIMKELVTTIVSRLTVWSPKTLQLTENTRNITARTTKRSSE